MGERTRDLFRGVRRQPVGIQLMALVAVGSLIAGVTVVSTRDTSPKGPAPTFALGGTSGSGSTGGGSTPGTVQGGASGLPTAPGGGVAPGDGTTGGAISSGSGGTAGGGASGGGTKGGSGARPIKLTASDRGVTATSLKVVFPWFTSASSDEITGTSTEMEPQDDAIKAFVDDINAHGGILGRKIDPIITVYDPINSIDMQQKCERWANDDKVFAVVDGAGAWHSTNQTCLANNKTPLISGWTTVRAAAVKSAPYVWWTAPAAEDIIDDLVIWANRKGLVTTANQAQVGMAFSDRSGVDDLARDRMNTALKRLGLTKVIANTEIIPSNNAGANAALPGAIQRFKNKNIKRVIMMLPFTTFNFWLNHADAQEFFPTPYILSDFESTMVVAEALLGPQHPRSLNKAIGPVSLNLGVKDEPSAYTAEEKRCNAIWKKAWPDADHANLERGGLGFRWCQGVTVFAEAARAATLAAGGAITRLKFGPEGVATLRDFKSPMTPTLSWAPNDYSGTEWMKVVEVHTSGCPQNLDTDANGICHVEVEPFARISRF